MKKVLLLSVALYGASYFAQDAISTGGDSFSNASGRIDFTVGEPIIETINLASNQLTQGFHQPEIQITELSGDNLGSEMLIYPNPTSGSVSIQMNQVPEGLWFLLYDAAGKLVKSNEVIQRETTINMNDCSSGVYVLKFSNKTTSFRIQKTN